MRALLTKFINLPLDVKLSIGVVVLFFVLLWVVAPLFMLLVTGVLSIGFSVYNIVDWFGNQSRRWKYQQRLERIKDSK